VSLDDPTAILLAKIADALERTGQVMAAAAHASGADHRPITRDHAQGMADMAIAATQFVREIAVAPADARQQIADYLVLVPPDDLGESIRGKPVELEVFRARD
jgi:hypothetical protein